MLVLGFLLLYSFNKYFKNTHYWKKKHRLNDKKAFWSWDQRAEVLGWGDRECKNKFGVYDSLFYVSAWLGYGQTLEVAVKVFGKHD